MAHVICFSEWLIRLRSASISPIPPGVMSRDA